jgi:Skp family chaperone for outer membrane proteins
MNIRVIDFDLVTKNYTVYQEGMADIRKVRDGFKDRVEPIRKEMQNILLQSNSGLVLDTLSQQERAERFQKLQQDLVEIDGDYKKQMQELHDSLNVKTYDELKVIVSDWAIQNSIDLVTGTMEVIFVNSNYDSTEEILELLKTKNLYTEPVEDKLPETQN